MKAQEINEKEAIRGQFEPYEDIPQPPEAVHKTKYAKEVNRGQNSEFENQNLKNKDQLWKSTLTSNNAGPAVELVKSLEDGNLLEDGHVLEDGNVSEDGNVLETAKGSEAASEDMEANDDVSKENLRLRNKSKSFARYDIEIQTQNLIDKTFSLVGLYFP